MSRRVVITGVGVLCSLGNSRQDLFEALRKNESAVRLQENWSECDGLKTRLAAPLAVTPDISKFSKKLLRSTGGVAQYALVATSQALDDAGLTDLGTIDLSRIGVAYGSGFGAAEGFVEFGKFMETSSTRGLSAGTYHKIMAHTCATHVALCFGAQGRLICTSTACTSGSQAIGYGYETILNGSQDIMLCGGAEELSLAVAAMFDVLCACSLECEDPHSASRPFDRRRDGMVVGEGACTVVLEDLDHAIARNANILAEVVAFSTNCDASHITVPNRPTIEKCFIDALKQSGLRTRDIGYINAHATGTLAGDATEAAATANVYGNEIPVSSLKGHLGHTLGACGAIEFAATIEAMRQEWIPPTRNLEQVDRECDGLFHVMTEGIPAKFTAAVCNTVAFGGVNTSLIIKAFNA